jgi:hypothetical protein
MSGRLDRHVAGEMEHYGVAGVTTKDEQLTRDNRRLADRVFLLMKIVPPPPTK